MKNQALFSSKVKSKNLKCRLLQFLFGALRAKYGHVCSLTLQETVTKISEFTNSVDPNETAHDEASHPRIYTVFEFSI